MNRTMDNMNAFTWGSVSIESGIPGDSETTPLLLSSALREKSTHWRHSFPCQTNGIIGGRDHGTETDVMLSGKRRKLSSGLRKLKSWSWNMRSHNIGSDSWDSGYLGFNPRLRKASDHSTSTDKSSSYGSLDFNQDPEEGVTALPSASEAEHNDDEDEDQKQTVPENCRGAISRMHTRVLDVFNAGYEKLQTDPEEKAAQKEAKRKRLADVMGLDLHYPAIGGYAGYEYFGTYPYNADWRLAMGFMMF